MKFKLSQLDFEIKSSLLIFSRIGTQNISPEENASRDMRSFI